MQLSNNPRNSHPPDQDVDKMSKQSEGKRGVDLIFGELLFVNFLGEFPRSSTHFFGYIVRLLEERCAELRRMRDRYIANAQENLVL